MQIVKILITHDVSSISPLAIGTLTLGMILIQQGFIRDKAGWVYIWGNGVGMTAGFITLFLYFLYV